MKCRDLISIFKWIIVSERWLILMLAWVATCLLLFRDSLILSLYFASNSQLYSVRFIGTIQIIFVLCFIVTRYCLRWGGRSESQAMETLLSLCLSLSSMETLLSLSPSLSSCRWPEEKGPPPLKFYNHDHHNLIKCTIPTSNNFYSLQTTNYIFLPAVSNNICRDFCLIVSLLE